MRTVYIYIYISHAYIIYTPVYDLDQLIVAAGLWQRPGRSCTELRRRQLLKLPQLSPGSVNYHALFPWPRAPAEFLLTPNMAGIAPW